MGAARKYQVDDTETYVDFDEALDDDSIEAPPEWTPPVYRNTEGALAASDRTEDYPVEFPDSTKYRYGQKNSRRTAPRSDAPSEKQLAFARQLWEATTVPGGEHTSWDDFAEQLRTKGEWTKRSMSKLIDGLKPLADKVRAEERAAASTSRAAQSAEVPVGMHKHDDRIYRVVVSRESGRRYAKQLSEDGTHFDYAQGAIRNLSADTLLSLEEAMEFGKATGQCCVCARTLTNPESIELGIGPICRQGFGA